MTETVNVDGAKLRRFLTIAGDDVCDADEYDQLHADLSADLPPEPEPQPDADVVAALTRARGQYAVDAASREILRRLAAQGFEAVPVKAVRERNELREVLRRLVVDFPAIRQTCDDALGSCPCSAAQALRLIEGGEG